MKRYCPSAFNHLMCGPRLVPTRPGAGGADTDRPGGPFRSSSTTADARPRRARRASGRAACRWSTGTPAIVSICEFKTQVLPGGTIDTVRGRGSNQTWVWGYQIGDTCNPTPDHSYIGPVVVAERGTPTQMTFINQLGRHLGQQCAGLHPEHRSDDALGGSPKRRVQPVLAATRDDGVRGISRFD